MTAVRLTADGPARYSAGGVVFEPGDVHDVSDGLAEHLLAMPFFEAVDVGDDGDESRATCETVKEDGEVCGRELPCPYHSEAEA